MRALAFLPLLWATVAGAQQAEVLPVPEGATVEAAPVPAQEWPRILAIEFEGNATTEPKVMLREMVVKAGDAADPEKIARSVQYIHDLGLFRRVRAYSHEAEGGVVLRVTVEEKWYVLPYPKFSVTVEGQNSTGAELRWSNFLGLNHSLRVNALRSDFKREGRGRETSYSGNYSAPFIFDSPYRLSLSTGYTLSPVSDPVVHDETFRHASFAVSRTYPEAGGARSQGTTFSGGVLWQREDRSGIGVPAPYGQATSLTGSYGYRNIRFRTYSEEGVSWRLGAAAAREGIASDYSYFSADASYNRYRYIGDTPHQSLNYSFSTGLYSQGPREINAYSFGGSSVLRGYKANSLEGNFYYLATAEFFRPVWVPWLRAGSILEAGKVFRRSGDARLDELDASLALAVRIRFTYFVNLDLDLGYAFPLNGGEGKLFGGRV